MALKHSVFDHFFMFLQQNENEKSGIEQKMEDLMQHLENPYLIVTPTPGLFTILSFINYLESELFNMEV